MDGKVLAPSGLKDQVVANLLLTRSTESGFRDISTMDNGMRSAILRKRKLSPSSDVERKFNAKFKVIRVPGHPDFLKIQHITNPKKKPRHRGRQENRTHQPDRVEDLIFSARRTLSANFKTLKEEMDCLQVVRILKQNRVLDDDFYKKFCEKKTRKDKVVALVVQLDWLMVEGNHTQKMRVFPEFIKALNESDQDELSTQLQAPANTKQQLYPIAEVSDMEVSDMDRFFHQAKDKIIETVEPRRFLDDVVTVHGIDLQEYNNIITKAEREDRVKELLNKITLRQGNMLQIIKPMCDCYRDLFSNFRQSGRTETALATGIDTPVAVRYNFIEKVIQEETNEHFHPLTELKKVHQKLVDSVNNNPEEQERLQEKLVNDAKLILSKTSVSSVKLHLRTTSVNSLKDLKECCQNGKAIAWLRSLLKPEDIKMLEELEATDVQLECYFDDEASETQLFDEAMEECLCVLTKDMFKSNLSGLKDDLFGLESQVMDTLLKSEVLNESQAKSLSEVQASGHNIKTQQDLITFLLQDEIPQLCFCMIEKLLAENNKISTIQHLKGDLTESPDVVQEKVRKVERKRLREYTDLLEEELDARWFLSSLKAKREQKFANIVEVIEKARSRKGRTKPFVRFLCKEEDDMEWFVKVLEECNPHLLEMLSHQENLKQTSVFKNAMLSVCEFITNEIEPSELKSHMTAACVKELQLDKIETISSDRRERAIFFLIQLFRSKNDGRIQDVMDAFASEYANVEKVIKDVSKSRSLCSYYQCPRLKKHQMPKFIFTGRFTLLELEKKDEQPEMQLNKYQNYMLDIKPKGIGLISSNNAITEQTYDNAVPLQMEADSDAQCNAEKVENENELEDKETKWLQKETSQKCNIYNMHSTSETTDTHQSQQEVILNWKECTVDNGDKESMHQNCEEKFLFTQFQEHTSPENKEKYEPLNDKKESESNTSQITCLSSQQSVGSKPTDNLLIDTTVQDLKLRISTDVPPLITQPCKTDNMVEKRCLLQTQSADDLAAKANKHTVLHFNSKKAEEVKEKKQSVCKSNWKIPGTSNHSEIQKIQNAKTNKTVFQNNDKPSSVSGIASNASKKRNNSNITTSDKEKEKRKKRMSRRRRRQRQLTARYHFEQKWAQMEMPSKEVNYHQLMQRKQWEDYYNYQRWQNFQKRHQRTEHMFMPPYYSTRPWYIHNRGDFYKERLAKSERKVSAVRPLGNSCERLCYE